MSLKCIVNHIGFRPGGKKTVIIPGTGYVEFAVQDMQQVVQEDFRDRENWKTIYKGKLTECEWNSGKYLTGDFSNLTVPGTYRVVVGDAEHWSYQFTISETVFSNLPFLFLDFLHNWRSGDHGLHWRTPCNMDDAVRSDNGKQIDVSGGWNDAGDLRKWMVHTNLPLSGFLDMYLQTGFERKAFAHENVSDNDFITESVWALNFMLKMQDRETGMFFEDVAGGGDARETKDLKWWYENHAGCVADNSENRFTDNMPSSGDERTVRVSYNPIAQYTTIYLLLKAARILPANLQTLAAGCRDSALRGWQYMTAMQSGDDPFHAWTSVISWKLMAASELYRAGEMPAAKILEFTRELLALQSEKYGFWFMNTKKNDPYRGILHSAQPLIALGIVSGLVPDGDIATYIRHSLEICAGRYIKPAAGLTPFRFMPYGFYFIPASDEVYHKTGDGLYYRHFMPDNSAQKLNHGLNGHWMSWAHALALTGSILHDHELSDLAWEQIFWAFGHNPAMASLVTGTGYNNPMPHSRFFGPYPGGFMSGFIGDRNDRPVLDLEGRAQWNTTEYWNTPLANCLMALAELWVFE